MGDAIGILLPMMVAAVVLHIVVDPMERPLLAPAASGVLAMGASEILPLLTNLVGWQAKHPIEMVAGYPTG